MVYSGHPRYLIDLRLNSPAAWEAAHGLGYTSPDITPPRTPLPKGKPTEAHKDKLLSVPGTEIIYFGRTALPAIPLGAAPPPPADSDYLLAPYEFISAPGSPASPAPSSPNWSETSLGDSGDSDKSDSAISALSSDLASLNLDASVNLATNDSALTPVTPKQRIGICLTDSPPAPAPITPDATLVATLEEISALVASDDDGSKTSPKKKEEEDEQWGTVWWDVWDAEKAAAETRAVDLFCDTSRDPSELSQMISAEHLIRPLSDDETTDSSNDEQIARPRRKKARSAVLADCEAKFRRQRRMSSARLIAA